MCWISDIRPESKLPNAKPVVPPVSIAAPGELIIYFETVIGDQAQSQIREGVARNRTLETMFDSEATNDVVEEKLNIVWLPSNPSIEQKSQLNLVLVSTSDSF